MHFITVPINLYYVKINKTELPQDLGQSGQQRDWTQPGQLRTRRSITGEGRDFSFVQSVHTASGSPIRAL